ncbi:MAG: hypothetical protein AAGF97_07865, partial [Planctomycetota bacterium]
ADQQRDLAEGQAKLARRFASMAGTPMLRIDELQKFRESWLSELQRLSRLHGDEDEEYVRRKCEYATWLFYAGLNAQVEPLQQEADLLLPEIRPVARRVLGVEDSAYQSVLLAHVHSFGSTLKERRFDQITEEECRRLAPAFEDLSKGFRNAFDNNLPAVYGFDLEHAVVVAKLQDYDRAVDLARNYLGWRLEGHEEPNRRFAIINQTRLEAVQMVFAPLTDSKYQPFQQDLNEVLQSLYARSVTEQTFSRLIELYQATAEQLPGLQPGEFLKYLKDLSP